MSSCLVVRHNLISKQRSKKVTSDRTNTSVRLIYHDDKKELKAKEPQKKKNPKNEHQAAHLSISVLAQMLQTWNTLAVGAVLTMLIYLDSKSH